jgi:hypothetical protein
MAMSKVIGGGLQETAEEIVQMHPNATAASGVSPTTNLL